MGRTQVCLGVVLSITVIYINAFRAVFTECDVVKCTQCIFELLLCPSPIAAKMGTSAPHIPRSETKSPGIIGGGAAKKMFFNVVEECSQELLIK